MTAIVQQYLDRLSSLDWKGLREVLADSDFERVGPFADVIDDKEAYVTFLDRVCSALPNYSVTARRIHNAGSVVTAEITESFDMDGQRVSYPEVLLFDLDGAGLIHRVQVYMMRPGEEPPVAGASATGAGAASG